jgi:hypothetical protein
VEAQRDLGAVVHVLLDGIGTVALIVFVMNQL